MEDVVHTMPQGFSLATLMRGVNSGVTSARLTNSERTHLALTFAGLVAKNDVILVDADLDDDNALPLPAMSDGVIVVQLSPGTESIKSAYKLIKRLGHSLERSSFSLIVTGASDKVGAQMFQNMAAAATRYLALDISSLGSVPADESFTRSLKLRRSVVEAFPMAKSAEAFRRIAEQFSAALV
jgi:flagellar biosynthesis protein FlhG